MYLHCIDPFQRPLQCTQYTHGRPCGSGFMACAFCRAMSGLWSYVVTAVSDRCKRCNNCFAQKPHSESLINTLTVGE